MPDTGPELIDAILGKATLMALDNCPGVPAELGRAVYGTYQDDSGPGLPPDNLDLAVNFSGSSAQTAVWHFASDNPVHHFVVVPWITVADPRVVYTTLMAYENRYTLGNYVAGAGNAPGAPNGYGHKSQAEFRQMLNALQSEDAAWQTYFGQVGAARTTGLKYWKYNNISLSKAIKNVGKY